MALLLEFVIPAYDRALELPLVLVKVFDQAIDARLEADGLQAVGDGLEQLHGVERFLDEVIRAESEGLQHRFLGPIPGDDDDLDLRVLLLDPSEQFDAR